MSWAHFCLHQFCDYSMFSKSYKCSDIIFGKGLMASVETVCPKRFQGLESQVLNSAIIVKTWGHGIAKNEYHFKTWDTKSWKRNVRIRPVAAKSWQSCSLVFMSWKTMSWKFLLVSNVEIIWLKSLQELESQVLNSAIIVKTWGHGIAKKHISKLGIPSLEKVSDFLTVAAKSWNIFPNEFMSWKTKSWKTKFMARV